MRQPMCVEFPGMPSTMVNGLINVGAIIFVAHQTLLNIIEGSIRIGDIEPVIGVKIRVKCHSKHTRFRAGVNRRRKVENHIMSSIAWMHTADATEAFCHPNPTIRTKSNFPWNVDAIDDGTYVQNSRIEGNGRLCFSLIGAKTGKKRWP